MVALLIANTDDCDAGFVGQRFIERGWCSQGFTVCHRETPDLWPTLDDVDLVVLLGSSWSAYWPEVAANVKSESELIEQTHNKGIPMFGICFGSQIIATALGGSAHRAQQHEIGWTAVSADDQHKPLAGTWMQWHYDSFIPPSNAQILATSPAGPQAIRLGRTFATQFHPEATTSIVERWASGQGKSELATVGLDVDQLIAETHNQVVQSAPAAQRLVDWFIETVAS